MRTQFTSKSPIIVYSTSERCSLSANTLYFNVYLLLCFIFQFKEGKLDADAVIAQVQHMIQYAKKQGTVVDENTVKSSFTQCGNKGE